MKTRNPKSVVISKNYVVIDFLSPMEFNSKIFKRGFKGLSIDKQAIFETLADHILEDYKQIEDAYKTETNRELTKDLEKTSLIL